MEMNFGNWAGPGYCGGTTTSKPKDFVDLFEKVKSRGFLDAAAQQHDAVYEYAERVYGKEPANADMKAMKNAIQFVADMDLVKNALAYKPDASDFIGNQYRKMLVVGFYYQAVKAYGMAAQMKDYWKDELQQIDPGFSEPYIPGGVLATLPAVPWILAKALGPDQGPFGWGNKGLGKLSTSAFLTDKQRYDGLGLTEQEMLLFNPHLNGSDLPTRSYDGASSEIVMGGRMVVIPACDDVELPTEFRFDGTWDGRRVKMKLTEVGKLDTGRDFELRVQTGSVWHVTKWDANLAADDFGNRIYTKSEWDENDAGVVITAETVAGSFGGLPEPTFVQSALSVAWREAVKNNPDANPEDVLGRFLADRDAINAYLPDFQLPSSFDKPRSLLGEDAGMLAEEARTSEAVRYALVNAEPFAREGANLSSITDNGAFDLYDKETGEGQFTDQYITDRTNFVAQEMNNPELFDTYAVRYEDSTLDYEYGDVEATTRVVFCDASGETFALNALQVSAVQVHLYGGAGADDLQGGDKADYLQGNAGNDTLKGGEGRDTLLGGTEDDTLEGGKESDLLNGGLGNDTYQFTSGDGWDWIEDKDGLGHIKYDDVTLSGGKYLGPNVWQKTDELTGKTFTYSLYDRTEGNETYKILAIQGPDGGLWVKRWSPGQLGITLPDAPADVIPPSPASTRTIIGDIAPKDFYDAQGHLVYLADDLGNLITDPDKIEPARADTLYDSPGVDLIQSGGGADHIDANRGGADRIEAGAGDDWVSAGAGDDRVLGGTGSDLLGGGQGKDILEGGTDSDALFGDIGDDQLFAEALQGRNDALAANDLSIGVSATRGDLLDGGAGEDLMVGGADADLILGGADADLLLGGAGNDNLWGDTTSTYTYRDWSVERQVELRNNVTHYKSIFARLSIETNIGAADVMLGGAGDFTAANTLRFKYPINVSAPPFPQSIVRPALGGATINIQWRNAA